MKSGTEKGEKKPVRNADDTQQEFPDFKPEQVKAMTTVCRQYESDIDEHQTTTKDLKNSRQKIQDTMVEQGVPIFKFRKRLYKLQQGEQQLIIEKIAEPKKKKGQDGESEASEAAE